jgi:hypothetical protein
LRIYSLSQSIIYVPITLIAAISRVAFSHFAKAEMESRPRLYSKVANLLAAVLLRGGVGHSPLPAEIRGRLGSPA